METELTYTEKVRRFPWSFTSNAANSVFAQFTFFGSAFVLFLSELNFNKTEIGFLLSLLPFSGLLALIVSPTVARFGYKRTYIVFWGSRKFVTALLILTPWVLTTYGSRATLFFVFGVVAVFAILRAVAETALYPWIQEYVPGALRGKYSAMDYIFSTLSGFLAVIVAGFVIERSTGLERFTALIAVGVIFGLICVWTASFIPGGAPVPIGEGEVGRRRQLSTAMRDRDFILYIVGAGLVLLVFGPLVSFLPLFMQEQIGISQGGIVMLQLGTLLGGLLSSYLWGWAADRYGSKPAMLSGVYLMMLLSLGWMLMPRQSPWSIYVALGIAVLQGIAAVGWGIGSARLLFVNVVPSAKKADYLALYLACIGVIGGLSQLIGGGLLDFTSRVSGRFLIFTLDPYTPLFLAGLVFPALSIIFLSKIRAGSGVSAGEFAGMFLRGNPFRAVQSLIRYPLAREERAAVAVTERLGLAKSPLTVEELLESLSDPRFNVRFEAIVSIGRAAPDPRWVEALADVLICGPPALSVLAAWALGRLGDHEAIEPLREGLNSEYRSVRDHCARSLGALRDTQVIPQLLKRLENEPDRGLQVAYATTLGALREKEVTTRLLELLSTSQLAAERMELALALARLVGDEGAFIRLYRESRKILGVAASQALDGWQKSIDLSVIREEELSGLVEHSIRVLARENVVDGIASFAKGIHLLPYKFLESTCAVILRECARGMEVYGDARLEYLLLALHALNCGWKP